MKHPAIRFWAACFLSYVVALAPPAEGISIQRGEGVSAAVAGGGISNFVMQNSREAFHESEHGNTYGEEKTKLNQMSISEKEHSESEGATDLAAKSRVGYQAAKHHIDFAGAPGKEQIIPFKISEDQPGQESERAAALPATEIVAGAAYANSSEGPAHEKLLKEEFLEMPISEGIKVILAQSEVLVSKLKDSMAESEALKEASRLASEVRGQIVRDVDALSRTLKEEHENLGVLRNYEQQQDALLKAQLGYLNPVPKPRIPESDEVVAVSGGSAVGVPTQLILACAATAYLTIFP